MNRLISGVPNIQSLGATKVREDGTRSERSGRKAVNVGDVGRCIGLYV